MKIFIFTKEDTLIRLFELKSCLYIKNLKTKIMRQKKIFLKLILVLSLSISTFYTAQNLSAKELLTKSSCIKFDCMDTFLKSKNFNLKDINTSDYYDSYLYTSKIISKIDGERPNTVIFLKALLRDWENSLQYTITSPDLYAKLYTSFFKEHHFVLKGPTETDKDTFAESHFVSKYKSELYKNIELRIHIVTKVDKDLRWINYKFEILNKVNL